MLTRRAMFTAGIALPVVLPTAAALAAEPAPVPATAPTVAELLKKPEVLDASLSPNGERVAVLREINSGAKRTAYIYLMKASALEEKPTPVVIGDYDVEQVLWANDERLLIWISFSKGSDGKPTGYWFDAYTFVPVPVRRIMSVDADGKNPVVLFGNQKKALEYVFDLSTLVDLLVDDPRNVLIQAWDEKANVPALQRVDVHTGEAVLAEKGVKETDGWFTQKGVPVLRWDSNSRGTEVTVMARGPGETTWKRYRQIRRDELKKLENFDVVGSTPEGGVLLVNSRADGEDCRTIRKFDVRTLSFGETVAKAAGRDMNSVLCDQAMNLVASSYIQDRRAYVFADPKLAAHYRGINSYFGNECNVTLYETNATHSRFIVTVNGPRQPRAFYLYDVDAHDLEPLGEGQPWLAPGRLPTMESLAVKTRDGAQITAYLTQPMAAFKGPYPLVVMPHGGPESRDNYEFDLFSQAMALNGWMVLQPNFRGSGGYGKAFGDLGRKHWADRMQEDVEDAVAQVLASGRVDKDRVVIWGASYGGYAALMEAIRNPTLYKAVVAVAGVYDLEKILEYVKREDGRDSQTYAYWLASIGDPKTDAALLEAASPANRAAEVKAPVLLMHGTADRIVDPTQSNIMAAALKAAGKSYTFTPLKGEGHRGWSDATLDRVLSDSIGFFNLYIRSI